MKAHSASGGYTKLLRNDKDSIFSIYYLKTMFCNILEMLHSDANKKHLLILFVPFRRLLRKLKYSYCNKSLQHLSRCVSEQAPIIPGLGAA